MGEDAQFGLKREICRRGSQRPSLRTETQQESNAGTDRSCVRFLRFFSCYYVIFILRLLMERQPKGFEV